MLRVEYNFKIKEFKENTEIINISNKEFAKELSNAIRTVLYNETKKFTPVKTGYLKSGWKHAGLTHTGNAFRTKVYNDVKYAEFVEYGTGGMDGTRFEGKKDIEFSKKKRMSYAFFKNLVMPEDSFFNTLTERRFMLMKGTQKAQEYVDNVINRGGIY